MPRMNWPGFAIVINVMPHLLAATMETPIFTHHRPSQYNFRPANYHYQRKNR